LGRVVGDGDIGRFDGLAGGVDEPSTVLIKEIFQDDGVTGLIDRLPLGEVDLGVEEVAGDLALRVALEGEEVFDVELA
jgi:hypothetical protein